MDFFNHFTSVKSQQSNLALLEAPQKLDKTLYPHSNSATIYPQQTNDRSQQNFYRQSQSFLWTTLKSLTHKSLCICKTEKSPSRGTTR